MLVRIRGVNTVTAKLADGTKKTYYYHRATGTKLEGKPGTPEFTASLDAAKSKAKKRTDGTLSGLIRDFEGTVRWRKLADSTKLEYKRVFKFWDAEYGTLPLLALEAKAFRQKVLKWHATFAKDKPREADNRVTILARILSWGAKDGPLHTNALDGFERAYDGDRSEIIWLPEHIDAFMAKADHEMQLAMVLALHTGQRQADIRAMAWNNYDGQRITIRQGKSRRGNKPGTLVSIKCTKALKDTLDNLPKTGALILTTKTGRAFQKRYFARRWDETATGAQITGLNFHDLRGTAVTMLFEAGCSVAEVASITGHTMRRAQEILDKYLARTSKLAENAIIKLENVTETNAAKQAAKWYKGKPAK